MARSKKAVHERPIDATKNTLPTKLNSNELHRRSIGESDRWHAAEHVKEHHDEDNTATQRTEYDSGWMGMILFVAVVVAGGVFGYSYLDSLIDKN